MSIVKTLHISPEHSFSKFPVNAISLIAGFGIEGDAHAGPTVKHRSRVAMNPLTPNMRQVHLIPEETLHQLNENGYDIQPGDLGENITTSGLNLYELPTGTLLRIGEQALLSITGLRNPCAQIENFRTGLLKQCLPPDDHGIAQRRAGVMAIVIQGGVVYPNDQIATSLPPLPHFALEKI